jgi:hypothetical protein
MRMWGIDLFHRLLDRDLNRDLNRHMYPLSKEESFHVGANDQGRTAEFVEV